MAWLKTQVHNGVPAHLQGVARKRKVGTVPVKVLDGVSGVLRPGRLTPLMGPPGAGKSVFLKVAFKCLLIVVQQP